MNNSIKTRESQNQLINVLLKEINIKGTDTDKGVKVGLVLLTSVKDAIAFKKRLAAFENSIPHNKAINITFIKTKSLTVDVFLFGSYLGKLKVDKNDIYIDYSMDWFNVTGISDSVFTEFRECIKTKLTLI